MPTGAPTGTRGYDGAVKKYPQYVQVVPLPRDQRYDMDRVVNEGGQRGYTNPEAELLIALAALDHQPRTRWGDR